MESCVEQMWRVYEEARVRKEDESTDGNGHGNGNVCPNCEEASRICQDHSEGTMICTACGYVLEYSMIDDTAEWNACVDRQKADPARCGTPINPLLEKSSMSTMIHVRSARYSFMQKLHNQSSMNYVERSRYHIFENIQKMGHEHGQLPVAVIEQAKYYYTELSKRKLSRGVIRKGLIACCLLYACKNHPNATRSIKEIAEMTQVTVPTINRTNKIFMKHMNDILSKTDKNRYYETHNQTRGCDYVYEATESSDLITRYCNQLHISDRRDYTALCKLCKKLNSELRDAHVLDCKTPNAIVSGIMMYACQRLNMTEVTKTVISKRFQVSIVTINKIVRLIETHYKDGVS